MDDPTINLIVVTAVFIGLPIVVIGLAKGIGSLGGPKILHKDEKPDPSKQFYENDKKTHHW